MRWFGGQYGPPETNGEFLPNRLGSGASGARLISAAESARGGSLSAISPASFIAVGGPAATARTLKPFPSSSADAAVAAGGDWVKPMTAAKAPFTTR